MKKIIISLVTIIMIIIGVAMFLLDGGKRMAKNIEVGDRIGGQTIHFDFSSLNFEDFSEFNSGETVILTSKLDVTNPEEYNFKVVYLPSMGMVNVYAGGYLVYQITSETTKTLLHEYLYLPYDRGVVQTMGNYNLFSKIKLNDDHTVVNTICENMCLEEGMSKEQLCDEFFNIYNKVSLNEVKYVEGTISNVTAGNQGQTTIEFPEGFTRDNTMITSIGVLIGNDTDALIEFRQQNDSLKYDYDVYMDNDGIVITMKNNNISFMSDFKFKVLLTKVS